MPDLLTRRETAELGEVTLTAVNKAVEQRLVKAHRHKHETLLEADDVAFFALLNELPLPLPVALKRQVHAWLVTSAANLSIEQLELSDAITISVTPRVRKARKRATEYARLRDRYLEKNPAVMGGEPVITGTRMPIRTLAYLLESGETPEVIREDHPNVPTEAYAFARLWARAHPRRGRPAAPWRDDADSARPSATRR
jgi:uncharacterized protein (DUF433 family)